MKALLVIDVQYDFLPGGALPVPNGNEVIDVINRVMPQFDLVVATQDWHPHGHKSFASSHPGSAVFSTIHLNGLEQVLWPDHCLQDEHGAELASELHKSPIEAIFRKGMNPEIDSYSGFYDNGHLKSTGLADYLKGRSITDVYVTGLAGDYCVYFSALDALDAKFNTYLVDDATRAINDQGYEKAKKHLANNGAKIILSSQL